MKKEEFKAFLSLLMAADPCPVSEDEKNILENFADNESKKYGFNDWIEAIHKLK